MDEKQLKQYQRVVDIVKSKEGQMLSNSYATRLVPMKFQCKKGHIFDKIPKSILKGHWCKICGEESASIKRRKGIDDIKEFVAKKNGSLLTTEYKNAHTYMMWKCHVPEHAPFRAIWNNVRNGYWCRVCAFEKLSIMHRKDIDALHAKASEHGGRLISTEYINSHTLVLWECALNHIFPATWGSVSQNHWCPTCNKSRGETAVARELEQLNITAQFQYSHPDCPNYSYDFYFEYKGRKYVLEYDGDLHFEFREHFHKNQEGFERRRMIDRVKSLVIYRSGICLIRIDYTCFKRVHEHIIKGIETTDPYYLSTPEMYTWLTNPGENEISIDFVRENTPILYDKLVQEANISTS